MSTFIREYTETDISAMTEIWNEVVEDGIAFPQKELLTIKTAKIFFSQQSFVAVAEDAAQIVGLYILHPNNVGRCGHIANASYGVKTAARGKNIGELLVKHSLLQGAGLGFKLLQFNAVVATNARAVKLYDKLGFVKVGTIPSGFMMKDGHYEDIIIFYIKL
jgi:L-amino acid N-acyltransferase YncA